MLKKFTAASYTYGASRTQPEMHLEKWAGKVAMTDVVNNVPNYPQYDNGKRYRDSHARSGGKYAGFNRLWFDGHSAWFEDSADAWYAYNCTVWGDVALANYQGNWNTYLWKKGFFDD